MSIGINERYLIEIASQCFGIDENIFFDCAADSVENIKTLSELFERDGSFMVLIQFQLDDSPALGEFAEIYDFAAYDLAYDSFDKFQTADDST